MCVLILRLRSALITRRGAATVVTATLSKGTLKKKTKMVGTQSLFQLSEKILACPHPEEITDWDAFYRHIQNSYAGRYKIYNLSGVRYDYHVFDGVVVEYNFKEDEAPTYDLFKSAVDDIVCTDAHPLSSLCD